jgi:hypothetical protein
MISSKPGTPTGSDGVRGCRTRVRAPLAVRCARLALLLLSPLAACGESTGVPTLVFHTDEQVAVTEFVVAEVYTLSNLPLAVVSALTLRNIGSTTILLVRCHRGDESSFAGTLYGEALIGGLEAADLVAGCDETSTFPLLPGEAVTDSPALYRGNWASPGSVGGPVRAVYLTRAGLAVSPRLSLGSPY